MALKDSILDLIKKEIIKYVARQVLGGLSSGIKYRVVYLTIDYLFDNFIAPILEEQIKEGLIRADVAKVRRKLKQYEEATTRDDRIDRYNDLP
jgi:hypothetical protein